ncbi:NAD(+) synthase [Patescibacteria group bacterium]|nr:NAD(+) synthase [Patescibacteria group bacterium]MBU1256802.1 NAD(+) synthase [Patescibacteria group bacterium]MBU1457353.1 NAD(+) synthase [Patescibacteria group bacterium]
MKFLTKKQCKKFINLAVARIAEYIKGNNLKGITLGISGGIDSAIVSVIGLRAIDLLKKDGYEANYEYVFLDCESDPIDYRRAKAHAKVFGYKLKYLDLSKWYQVSPLLRSIPKNHLREKVAKGNIKCRLRMISLYHSAQLNGHIYLDTDDLSEEYMGFWTKHGDEGDVKIIQHVTKSELYDLGKYLGVPKIILESKPGDGLKVTESNMASDQLGLEYIYIEYIISEMIRAKFDCNGSWDQLEKRKFKVKIKQIASEIGKEEAAVYKVIRQSLKTAFKRKYGDSVKHLLPNRKEFGFIEFGTEEFAKKQLYEIKK